MAFERQVLSTSQVDIGVERKIYGDSLENYDLVRYEDYDRVFWERGDISEILDELRDLNYYFAAELALDCFAGSSANPLNMGEVTEEDVLSLFAWLDRNMAFFTVKIGLPDRQYTLSKKAPPPPPPKAEEEKKVVDRVVRKKGPQTPLAFYIQENRRIVKDELGEDTSFGDVMREVGLRWKKLTDSERAKYVKMAAVGAAKAAENLDSAVAVDSVMATPSASS